MGPWAQDPWTVRFAQFTYTRATAAGLLEELPKSTGLRLPPLPEKTPFQKHRDISAFYADHKAQIPVFCAVSPQFQIFSNFTSAITSCTLPAGGTGARHRGAP